MSTCMSANHNASTVRFSMSTSSEASARATRRPGARGALSSSSGDEAWRRVSVGSTGSYPSSGMDERKLNVYVRSSSVAARHSDASHRSSTRCKSRFADSCGGRSCGGSGGGSGGGSYLGSCEGISPRGSCGSCSSSDSFGVGISPYAPGLGRLSASQGSASTDGTDGTDGIIDLGIDVGELLDHAKPPTPTDSPPDSPSATPTLAPPPPPPLELLHAAHLSPQLSPQLSPTENSSIESPYGSSAEIDSPLDGVTPSASPTILSSQPALPPPPLLPGRSCGWLGAALGGGNRGRASVSVEERKKSAKKVEERLARARRHRTAATAAAAAGSTRACESLHKLQAKEDKASRRWKAVASSLPAVTERRTSEQRLERASSGSSGRRTPCAPATPGKVAMPPLFARSSSSFRRFQDEVEAEAAGGLEMEEGGSWCGGPEGAGAEGGVAEGPGGEATGVEEPGVDECSCSSSSNSALQLPKRTPSAAEVQAATFLALVEEGGEESDAEEGPQEEGEAEEAEEASAPTSLHVATVIARYKERASANRARGSTADAELPPPRLSKAETHGWAFSPTLQSWKELDAHGRRSSMEQRRPPEVELAARSPAAQPWLLPDRAAVVPNPKEGSVGEPAPKLGRKGSSRSYSELKHDFLVE